MANVEPTEVSRTHSGRIAEVLGPIRVGLTSIFLLRVSVVAGPPVHAAAQAACRSRPCFAFVWFPPSEPLAGAVGHGKTAGFLRFLCVYAPPFLLNGCR